MKLTPRRTQKRRVEKRVQAALKRIRGTELNASIQPANLECDSAEDFILNGDCNFQSPVQLTIYVENHNMPKVVDELSGTPNKLVQLGHWATQFNINHNALKSLLSLVRNWLPHEGFPKDPRTLLKTKRKIKIQEIEGGSFYHFGIRSHILKAIENNRIRLSAHSPLPQLQNVPNLLSLKIGIDGLPISKSSNKQFWPILGTVDQDLLRRVFIISLFYGSQKPQNLESYLGPFVRDMVDLEHQGICARGVNYSVRTRCIVADAPARSFIKRINGHNGYYGCERCYRRGTYKYSRILYPIKPACDSYTDESFKERWYESHHKQGPPSPLELLNLGMISQIPLDYMHLCLLGTMKKLLLVWTEGKKPHKFSSLQKQLVTKQLMRLRCRIPSEFSRKCRSIYELKHWKATEFRLFLLYVGPVVLKKVLPTDKYEHFLLFHAAMHILVSNCSDKPEWVSYAKELINKFVQLLPKLYYAEFLVYNTHSLLHLADEVKLHGPLDNFSAFQFENFMQPLKSMLRSKSKHLSQVVKRVGESEQFLSQTIPKPSPRWSVGSRIADRCFMTKDNRICLLSDGKQQSGNFKGFYFKTPQDVKLYPCSSRKLGISFVSHLGSDCYISSDSLEKKCILLPIDNSDQYFYSIVLCNS